MKLKKAVKILKRHNEWRRGAEIAQEDPKQIGEAIDAILDYFNFIDRVYSDDEIN